jgi:PAS domain S-box-containing protein
MAVEFMKRGAIDYIVKDRNFWDLLPPAVERAFEQMETAARLVGTESALQKSERRFQAIFNNAAAGIGLMDPDGRFQDANSAMLDMFNMSESRLQTKHISEILSEEDTRDVLSRIHDILNRHIESARMEKEFLREDGSAFWGDLSITPIHRSTDNVEAIMGVLVDITERINAEAALRELNEQLERKVKRRTRQLEKANRRLKHSLTRIRDDERAGRRIQFKLLPPIFTRIGSFDCSRYLWPSMSVSGDFVDYFSINEHTLGFFMADVSGHGVSSALVTVLLKSMMTLLLHQYQTEQDATLFDPAECLRHLNTELITENTGKHVTIFYGLLDNQKEVMTYASAGQFPPPFISGNGTVHKIESRGTPLGLFSDSHYQNTEIAVPPTYTLALFSDGILDIMPGDDIPWKLKHLKDLVGQPGFSRDMLAQHFHPDRKEHLPDDIAFLCIKCGNPS